MNRFLLSLFGRLTFKILFVFLTASLSATSTVFSQVSQAEFDALVDIYENMNGENWTDNTGWNTSINNVSDAWFGVKVKNGHVTMLQLNKNNLNGTLPTTIGDLDSLVALNLNYANLTSLPTEISNLSVLGTLSLAYNNLNPLPPVLFTMTSLTTLNITGNNLSSIPSDIKNLVNLEGLNAADNNLTDLPAEIGNLNKLGNLWMAENDFSQLPSFIGGMSSLFQLGFYNCQLTSLIDLSGLTNLNYSLFFGNLLDFNDLSMANAPNKSSFFYSPQNLEVVTSESVNGNELTLVVTSIGENTIQWYKNGEEIAGANSVTLITTDPGIYHCELSHTSFGALTLESDPVSFGLKQGVLPDDYAALVDFYNSLDGDNWANNSNWLSNEDVENWYGVQVEYGSVVLINLSNNNLSGEVPDLERLDSLQHLYLSYNQISSIPQNIGQLSKLTGLGLRSNNLGEIPNSIQNMSQITYLDLSYNQLHDLPDLSGLINLNSCEVSYNLLGFNKLLSAGISATNFGYKNQNIELEITSAINGDITILSFTDTLGGESYQWYKDDVAIPSATSISLTTDEPGIYYCEITHSSFPELIFTTEKIAVGYINGVHPDDYNALVDFYDSLGGDNWKIKSNWKTEAKVSDWSGVTVNSNGRVIYMNFTNNNLAGTIPSSFEKLTALQHFFCFGSEISGTNFNIEKLENLSSFAIDVAKMESIPEGLTHSSSLTALSLYHNQLTELPDLSGLTNLTNLSVSTNYLDFLELDKLTVIPSNYFNYGNQLTILPISKTKNADNSVTLSFVDSVGGTTYQWYKDGELVTGETQSSITVNEFGVYKCHISNNKWPDLIIKTEETAAPLINGVYPQDYNALVALYNSTNGDNWKDNTNWLSDENVGEWFGVRVKDYRVDGLNFRNNNLSGSIPKEIGDLDNITAITLDSCSLNTLPEEFSNLQKLYFLSMCYNNFESIPTSIFSLTHLRDLSLYSNKITTVPDDIGALIYLNNLNLFRNNITYLSGEIGKLEYLWYFDISVNKLTELPGEIGNLKQLRWLVVHSNNLTDIPDLQNLTKLSLVSLSDNYFDFTDIINVISNPIQGVYYEYQKTSVPVNKSQNGSQTTLSFTDNVGGESYQWYNNDYNIDNQTDTSFTPTENGVYYCIITNSAAPSLKIQTQEIIIGEQNGVFEGDIEALVALYESTGGDNWTNNSNWKSDQEVSEWFGVTVENGRVTGINLPANNLIGVIPEKINDLVKLTKVDISNNQINELPSLSNLKLNSFDVSDNKLDFDDLNRSNINYYLFDYSPQANISIAVEEFDEHFTLTVDQNYYTDIKWSKNGELIDNEISRTIEIGYDSTLATDQYQCTILNSRLPKLTLQSEIFQAKLRRITDLNTVTFDKTVLYPNPASDKLYFKSKEISNIERIAIYDVRGKLVIFEENMAIHTHLDVSSLGNGMYNVIMEVKGQQTPYKLLINK